MPSLEADAPDEACGVELEPPMPFGPLAILRRDFTRNPSKTMFFHQLCFH